MTMEGVYAPAKPVVGEGDSLPSPGRGRGWHGEAVTGEGDLLPTFHLRQHLLRIQSGKELLRLLRHLGLRQQAKLPQFLKRPQPRPQLLHDLLRRLRQERRQQGGPDGEPLRQMIQHGSQSVLFRLILGQGPGGGLVNIFIAALKQLPDMGQGLRHMQGLHGLFHPAGGFFRQGHQFLIHRLVDPGLPDPSAEIFITHGHGTV